VKRIKIPEIDVDNIESKLVSSGTYHVVVLVSSILVLSKRKRGSSLVAK